MTRCEQGFRDAPLALHERFCNDVNGMQDILEVFQFLQMT